MACLDPVLDAVTGCRRIYLDLPGMGRTPAPETISSADDVLEVLLAFIDGVIGDLPLLVAGRQDSTVGYSRAWELLEQYPHATFAVLDGAGHALPHEQPELLRALVTEWLDRVREHASPRGKASDVTLPSGGPGCQA